MKAVFFETAPWERRYLTRALAKSKLQVRFLAEPLTEATRRLADGAAVLSVFIYSTLTSAVLRRLPRLTFIATRSTGFDHINLAATPSHSSSPSRATSTRPT